MGVALPQTLNQEAHSHADATYLAPSNLFRFTAYYRERLQIMNMSEATNADFEIVPRIDFSWVCSNDGALSHIRVIDYGGSAEVHEVPLKAIRELIFSCGTWPLVRYYMPTLSRNRWLFLLSANSR